MRLSSWLTGRCYSKPFRLMDEDDARAWVADHPTCSQCGQSIDVDRDNYVVMNNSKRGIWAHHYTCPDGGVMAW